MATAIEYGLISGLVAVVIVTGLTSTDYMVNTTSKFPYVAIKREPPDPIPHCPAGTGYVERIETCLPGAVAPVWK